MACTVEFAGHIALWRLCMQGRFLAVCVLAFGSLAAAHATSLAPGGSVSASTLAFGGTQIGFFNLNNVPDGGTTLNYAVQVFTDPNNVYGANNLDFVYSIQNTGKGTLSDVTVSNFSELLTSVGYSNQGGGAVNPTTISRSADGSLINFAFSPFASPSFTANLVVQTDANQSQWTQFGGFVGFTAGSVGDQPAPTPIPEPSTLVLLGSGLAGLATAAKRKLLA
jgi:hypothetical protein